MIYLHKVPSRHAGQVLYTSTFVPPVPDPIFAFFKSHLCWYSEITKLNISTFRDTNERHREASPQPSTPGHVARCRHQHASRLGRAAQHREARPGAGGAGVDQETDHVYWADYTS